MLLSTVLYIAFPIYLYIYINTSSSLSTTFASACDKNINKYKVDLTYIHIVRTPSIPLPYGTMIMRASSCAGNSLSMCMYIYICVDDMYIIFCCCKALQSFHLRRSKFTSVDLWEMKTWVMLILLSCGMCVCVYIYICICIYICMYVCVYAYKCTYIYMGVVLGI